MADLSGIQPTDVNFLPTTSFRFMLHRAPNLMFFSQSAAVPGITSEPVIQPTPFLNIPRPNTKLTFERFSIQFNVDHNLANYLEVFNWLKALGGPTDRSGYAALTGPNGRITTSGDHTVFSDGTMLILTAENWPNIEVVLFDMFPIALSPLNFEERVSGSPKVTCNATFAYRSFDVNVLASDK